MSCSKEYIRARGPKWKEKNREDCQIKKRTKDISRDEGQKGKSPSKHQFSDVKTEFKVCFLRKQEYG